MSRNFSGELGRSPFFLPEFSQEKNLRSGAASVTAEAQELCLATRPYAVILLRI